jgi:hypothetical protein
VSGHGDLIARAKANTEGVVVPESWGEVVELEEDVGIFIGRFRGQDTDNRGNPVFLFWDEDHSLRFLWPAYRLTQEMEKAQPNLGDTVCIARGANYKTRFDEAGDATGKAYGVSVEPNDEPLPGRDDDEADPDGLPF